jgi:ureidoglycolate hydrolase
MVVIEPLSRNLFEPFGDVLDVPEIVEGTTANQGTATRFNHLTMLVNKRSKYSFGTKQELLYPPAKENVCIFRVKPAQLPFTIK